MLAKTCLTHSELGHSITLVYCTSLTLGKSPRSTAGSLSTRLLLSLIVAIYLLTFKGTTVMTYLTMMSSKIIFFTELYNTGLDARGANCKLLAKINDACTWTDSERRQLTTPPSHTRSTLRFGHQLSTSSPAFKFGDVAGSVNVWTVDRLQG